MSKRTRGPPRGEQFRTARHVEKRNTKRGMELAARVDFVNQSEFGKTAEWVDAAGRQYRFAYTSRPTGWLPGQPVPLLPVLLWPRAIKRRSDGRVRLWVKLPKSTPASGWFQHLPMTETLELRPVANAVPAQQLRVVGAQRRIPSGRTGVVTVAGFTF